MKVAGNGRWLRGVENQWLQDHPEVLQEQGRKGWMKQYRRDTIFHNDVNTRRLKLKALEKLNIDVFLDPSNEFTNKSPEVEVVKEKLRKSSHLREVLGVNVTAATPEIALVNDILGRTLGTKLLEKKSNGNRTYSIEGKYYGDGLRREILSALERKSMAKNNAENSANFRRKTPETLTAALLRQGTIFEVY
ncbi:MAG: hypothetical protein N4J56_004636 [Chroococcidiopsis sp. SAG 2025]|uniref:hypothetical protein n=1 Tax=Chroococcidiopsis sp. SAG 2025 TaxID=171389 RepID=UPI002936FEF4|nr:hypothetical protein [Chroococcidiopsis sp. SAG 2025]MDV2994982.1 hypothetical protein [Chroococcidiopsis sp. SAG 2025]